MFSEYERLHVHANSNCVSIRVDGDGQGSRWIVLSALDARQFAHRVLVEADQHERLVQEEAARRAEEPAQSSGSPESIAN